MPRELPCAPDQGVVIISNHRSSIDPFFVQVVARRVVHWMVAADFFGPNLFGWFLRACEAIPTKRAGIDTASTKRAIRIASQGGAIGMFPEGRINLTEDFMIPVRPGAIAIALHARVPVLPVYIEGSPFGGTPISPFFMRARVKVHFGDLIDLSEYWGREHDKEIVNQLTRKCVLEIAKLAGKPDYEPQLAGKKWRPSDEQLHDEVEAFQKRSGLHPK